MHEIRIRLLLGILVIAAIVLAIYIALTHRGGSPETPGAQESTEESVPEPVVETLLNVWIMETDEVSVKLYCDGAEETFPLADGFHADESAREQIADVTLTDGAVTEITAKTDKIHGRVLGASADGIEIEGYGRIPLAEDYRGYCIYRSLEQITYTDLAFGYDFTDFVMEDGKICGLLLVREETMDTIRVLLMTADYGSLLHESLTVTSDADFRICYGENLASEELHSAGETVTLEPDSVYFEDGRIRIEPTVLSGRVILPEVKRSEEIAGYRGTLEVAARDGMLAVINELPLEEYLYSVVPSEMPASYGAEALKAQAVCARTYAYLHMEHAAYPTYGAHVDDSTSYQVYNNIRERETTTTAVKETYGQLLHTADGDLTETYYYSTSCGVGSDALVWKTEHASKLDYLQAREITISAMDDVLNDRAESGGASLAETLRSEDAFADFITSRDNDALEAQEPWYRWTYTVKKADAELISQRLTARFASQPEQVLTLNAGDYVSREPEPFEEILSMGIVKRGAGGVADELLLETDSGTYKIISENAIRTVLCNGETQVVRQDGSRVSMPNLVPSGFFILTVDKQDETVVGYRLTGGGFGHGAGMSQNAAKAMAAQGYSYTDILTFFYDDCTITELQQ